MNKVRFAILLIILLSATALTQEMAVPVNVQYSLFLKILTFDRNLETRVGDEIIIGIVYQRKFRRSLITKNELVKVMEESPIKKIENIPIRYVTIDIGSDSDLLGAVLKDNIDILYITPVRAVGIKTIADVSRANQIMTVTGVSDYVESGLAVGIGIKGEKPLIIINLLASIAEGADFSSQLLKLAKIIK